MNARFQYIAVFYMLRVRCFWSVSCRCEKFFLWKRGGFYYCLEGWGMVLTVKCSALLGVYINSFLRALTFRLPPFPNFISAFALLSLVWSIYSIAPLNPTFLLLFFLNAISSLYHPSVHPLFHSSIFHPFTSSLLPSLTPHLHIDSTLPKLGDYSK